jgi:hypothetical protein
MSPILKCFLNSPINDSEIRSEIVDWSSNLTRLINNCAAGSVILDTCCTKNDIYFTYVGEISAETKIFTLEGEFCANSDERFEKLNPEQILSSSHGPIIEKMVEKYGRCDVSLAKGEFAVRATSNYHPVVLSCLVFKKPIFFLPKTSALQKYGTIEKYFPRYTEKLGYQIQELINFKKKINLLKI